METFIYVILTELLPWILYSICFSLIGSKLIRYSIMEKAQKACTNFSNLSQDPQLIWFMNNESNDIINLFSIYIYDSFKLRENFIYRLCIAYSPNDSPLIAQDCLCICLIKFCSVNLCPMYFISCIYLLLLLNMPEMAHDWINKSILFYS